MISFSRNLVGYEAIASEYYDPLRHPTCANFREGSRRVLSEWLQPISLERLVLCEVGVGKSLLAELAAPRLGRLDNMFLIDDSTAMLAYSRDWEKRGAHLILGSAYGIPMPDASVDLLVSSLGDPYNEPAFWAEARRILRPGGRALLTTPSYEWARSFRSAQDTDMNLAEFELSSGEVVYVSSSVLPVSKQIRLMRDHGFTVDAALDVPVSTLGAAPISPKLLLRRGPEASMVTGYHLRLSSDGHQSEPIVGLAGHMNSGKTEASRFLEASGFRRVGLSDLLLEEAERRHLGSHRSELQELGNQVRQELGGSVLVDRALVRYFSGALGSGLVIDGIRNPAEALAVRAVGGVVVAIDRSPGEGSFDEAARAARQRESDPDEPAWGQRVADALGLADIVVENRGSKEDLEAEIVRALARIRGFGSEETGHVIRCD